MIAALLVPWLAGCIPARSVPPGPSVVVVSLDTVRADALGAWGGLPGTTPELDGLAATSMRFAAHVVPAPSTLASHTSLMTGLYPHHHGVPRNEYRVPDALDTLAEAFRDGGWDTAAILGAMPLGPHTGFVQGFDHVDDRFVRARDAGRYEQVERDASAVTDAALGWLDRPRQRPVFLFVHYFDAHQPYTAVPGDVAMMDDVYAVREALVVGGADAWAASGRLERLYRAELRALDAQVGRLIRGLAERGLADAVVVVWGDHGEAFALHDERWDHGSRCWEETVHTPLIWHAPGVGPGVVETPVSAVDLAPTLRAAAGLPPAPSDGVDLGPLLRGAPLDRGPVFTQATKPADPPVDGWFNATRPHAVRAGALKLHRDPLSGVRALYDLSADPSERHDVSSDPARADDLAALTAALDAWTRDARPLTTERVSDGAVIRQLEWLGYLE